MTADGDDDASSIEKDAFYNWQTIPIATKRTETKSPIGNESKKRNTTDDNPGTSNGNRFSILDVDNNDNVRQETADQIKPPPIFIPHVNNIVNMVDNIASVISRNDFSYKSMRNNEVKVMISSIESYRKLAKYFESRKIGYHTYQVRQERSYRVIFKGIHHSTPPEDIKLLAQGYGVRNVCNVRSRVTKEPLSMFYIDLEPSPNNKEIYEIRHINKAIITVEPPKKVNDIVQCHRCQQFGHTRAYCRKPFRCVKCALDHPTAECTMNKTNSPRCIHCLQNHTANYKGCQVYQKLIQKKPTSNSRIIDQPNNSSSFSRPQNYTNENLNSNTSYANVLKGTNNDESVYERLEKLMIKQIELTNTLLNMMSVLVTKLCN